MLEHASKKQKESFRKTFIVHLAKSQFLFQTVTVAVENLVQTVTARIADAPIAKNDGFKAPFRAMPFT